jgi:hypothetical protein
MYMVSDILMVPKVALDLPRVLMRKNSVILGSYYEITSQPDHQLC